MSDNLSQWVDFYLISIFLTTKRNSYVFTNILKYNVIHLENNHIWFIISIPINKYVKKSGLISVEPKLKWPSQNSYSMLWDFTVNNILM